MNFFGDLANKALETGNTFRAGGTGQTFCIIGGGGYDAHGFAALLEEANKPGAAAETRLKVAKFYHNQLDTYKMFRDRQGYEKCQYKAMMYCESAGNAGLPEAQCTWAKWTMRMLDSAFQEMASMSAEDQADLIKCQNKIALFLNQAAGKSHAEALFFLGVCEHHGYCMEKNPALSIEHIQKAAELGDPKAIKLLATQPESP